MDAIIKELTHDNDLFEKQWPNTLTRLQEVSASSNVTSVMNALADYVIAEPQHLLPCQIKFLFLRMITKLLVDNESTCVVDDLVLVDLVHAFTRVLDESTTGCWHLAFLETTYERFRLGERLCSTTPLKTELIEQILTSLQSKPLIYDVEEDKKKWQEFLTKLVFSNWTNALNNKQTMLAMRTAFQKFYRCAVRQSNKSSLWPNIMSLLTGSLPELFNSYDTPADALLDLTVCAEFVSSDHIYLIVQSFHNNCDLFKTNYKQVLMVIENLIMKNKFIEANQFVTSVIKTHFDAIDLEPLLQMAIRLCSLLMDNTIEHRNLLCSKCLSPLAYELSSSKGKKKLAPLFFEFALATLQLCVLDAPECALLVLKKAEFYPWKELTPRIADLVRVCASYDTIVGKSFFSKLDPIRVIIELVYERAKVNPIIFRATHNPALEAILRWSDEKTVWCIHVHRTGYALLALIDKEQVTVDICVQFVDALRNQVSNEDDNDEEEEDGSLTHAHFFVRLASRLAIYIDHLKIFPHAFHIQLTSFYFAALGRPLHLENGIGTFEFRAVYDLWHTVGSCLTNEDDARLYEPVLERMYVRAQEDNELQLYNWWVSFWTTVGMKLPLLAVNQVEKFLVSTIDRKDMNFLNLLTILYGKCPGPFHARIDDIVNALFIDNAKNLYSLAYLLWIIAHEHPELISSTHVNHMFNSIQSTSTSGVNILFQVLSCVSNYQPHFFDAHRAQLLRLVSDEQNILAFICLQQYLIASVIVGGEQTANENLTLLTDRLKDNGTSNDIRTRIFYACQLIGLRHKQALTARRNDFIAFDSNEACRMLLDFIDGTKMTEENQAAIERAQSEIGQIEMRIVKTEYQVQQVTQVVQQQELNVNNIRAEVDVVNTRLTDVAEQVQVHAREIERIDAKTLSYVPEWGREVSKLLNRRANNDWRLLGKRFGYSSSELRHWATQIDPSMALLNEWFMTHKTDEATFGLVKMLGEINRHDVEQVIRQAVLAAGEVILDDLIDDIKRLPPIFLSYQWGAQTIVTTLKDRLEEAGYACWMDTGQMGGGDKLFAKIDAGIRGAKVIVCCMNKAYAQSDNCSREVHLTVSTGKPLIPLQMEKQSWPPEGALGPIMSEYLYIRFFDRKNANNPNFWPEDKFIELLGQIRYHVAPDPDMISERYRNWFVPRIDNLIFIQPSDGKTKEETTIKECGSTSLTDIPLVVTHPQLMISYQWDHQTEIVILYKRLTQLGYRVWLDIFQMGGGDSLFEKIDTGIRHSLCVLACVTPKYTQSINCRREMALADALTKAIVPLLLEETSTWPPPGPMALVFAEKPYIDFRRQNEHGDEGRWTGKEFEQVLARLRQAVPDVHTDKPRRHLLDMQRPESAGQGGGITKQRPRRITSAPIVQQSRACSLM